MDSAANTGDRPSGPAGLRNYFEALLLLLLASGFLTLAAAGAISWPIVAAVTLAFGLRAALLARNQRPRIPRIWMLAAGAAYIPFYVLDIYAFSPNFLMATLHLVLFAAVLKMFAADQANDYAYLCVLAFLEVLAAALSGSGSGFVGFYLVFTAMMVATFTAFEMYRSHEAAARVAPAARTAYPSRPRLRTGVAPLTRSLARFSLLLTGGVMAFTALIFLVLPRSVLRPWDGQNQDSELTGFNDAVDLGAVADLQQSDQLVMHVRILDADPALTTAAIGDVLWRGRALESFDGRRWESYAAARMRRTVAGRLDLDSDTPPQPPLLLHYQVTLEPLGSQVLFYPARLLETTTRFPMLALDSTTTITSLGHGFAGTSYEGISDLSLPPRAELRAAAPAPPREFRRDLQLPVPLDPRVLTLTHSLTAGYSDSWDKLDAIAEYLRNNYQYTLENLPNGPDPVANFLFDRRAGSCEYFASALAVMGRVAGIPTRLVNGFELGQYNPISHEYIVRGRNAHSWVEAWFPEGDSGQWIAVDATPPTEGGAANSSQPELLLDAMGSLWQEWVVDYDWVRQAGLARQLADASAGARRGLQQFAAALSNALGTLAAWARTTWFWAALPVLALAAFWGGRKAQRRLAIRRGRADTWAAQRAAASYRKLQRMLARAGYPRAPAQTAEELLARLEAEPLRLSASRFVAGYESLRFAPFHGPQEAARSQLDALGGLLKEIRRLSARHRRK